MKLPVAALLLIIYGEVQCEQQECYICRAEGDPLIDGELEKQFPQDQLPICGLESPLREVCPPLFSKGCLTQKRGSRILSKMCSNIEVSECQEANDVTYCYCKGNLCNAEIIATTTLAPETDDEDLSSEGSGEGVTQPTSSTVTAQPTIKPHVKASSSSYHLAAPSIIGLLLSIALSLSLL